MSNFLESTFHLIIGIVHLSINCNHLSQKIVLLRKKKLILRVKNVGTLFVRNSEKNSEALCHLGYLNFQFFRF